MRRLSRVALCSAVIAAASSSATWAAFLKTPDRRSLDAIVGVVAACKTDLTCRQRSAPTSAEVSALIRMIEADQELAFEAGFAAKTTMPFAGGDLEDLIRALGTLSETHPSQFLRLIHTYGRDRDLLTMLPLASVDDFDLQRRMIAARLTALEAVSDSDLRADRDWAVSVLRPDATH